MTRESALGNFEERLDALTVPRNAVVDQNGQTMYCRKSVKTGSRVQSNMTCLTKDQLVAERRGTEDYIKMIQKGNPQMTN